LIFAKLVGDDGKVFAFEPEPANFDLLKKNVEINGYRNMTLVQKAFKIFLDEENLGHHHLYYNINDNLDSS